MKMSHPFTVDDTNRNREVESRSASLVTKQHHSNIRILIRKNHEFER